MTGSTATVYSFADPNDSAEAQAPMPTIAFRFGRDVFTMRRPKLSLAVGLVSMIDGGEFRETATQSEVVGNLIQTLWQLVRYIEPEDPEPLRIPDPHDPEGTIDNPQGGLLRGQARLLQRLNDPRDRFDVLDLAEPFATMCRAIFDRPIGPSPASFEKPAADGTDSAAASPEPQPATSGT